jgi:heme A synthase
MLIQQIRAKLKRKQDIVLIRALDLMNGHAVHNDDIVLAQGVILLVQMNGNRTLQNIDYLDFLMPMKRYIRNAVHEQPDRQVLLVVDKFVQITHRQGTPFRNIWFPWLTVKIKE